MEKMVKRHLRFIDELENGLYFAKLRKIKFNAKYNWAFPNEINAHKAQFAEKDRQ